MIECVRSLCSKRFKSMKLLTSQAFHALLFKEDAVVYGSRGFDACFWMAGGASCAVPCWCMWTRANTSEPPRERFCSRVQEHLHPSLLFKGPVSLGPISTSGNLNNVDEKSIIWSGNFETENCMVFTFLRGVQYRESWGLPLLHSSSLLLLLGV